MTSSNRQIIALGGGGFSMEPDNLLLDQYILEQSSHSTPRICFLPTASGDSDRYITRFYDAFTQLNCRPCHLSLFRPPTEGAANFLQKQDIVYVGGGSTFNLVTLLKAWKLDEALRQASDNGTILCGLSAGSICWFEEGLSDSVVPGEYAKLEALGFLPGSHCPHYDGENKRRPAYKQQIGNDNMSAGIAADDGVALHYIGDTLKHIVTSRQKANAYRVILAEGTVQEIPIQPRYLGNHKNQ
ncbi:MAG: Type 1 glutamine amidotransferase-like domain-containing protein [Phormidesmis sp.]